MSDPLLILGASARAAAGSAQRAGLNPSVVDLFCDDDLSVGVARRSTDYPQDLPALARGCPPGAWMYTGALENFPHIIDELSTARICWGTRGCSVRQVRNPFVLSRRLRQSSLLFPAVIRANRRVPPGHRWIRKPYASGGGGNMCLVASVGQASSTEASSSNAPAPILSPTYLQQFIEGEAQSAVFVAASGEAVLLGVTRQLTGADWTGATGFRYAGSIGPLQTDEPHVSRWLRIGDCLAREFDLQGLFGVDAIVNDDGIWTIEVNPRYTSSIEVLECGLEFHAVGEHRVACQEGRLHARSPAPVARFRGKAVIYASRDVRIDKAFVQAARQANEGHDWPVIADIPSAPETIAAGRPVATLFVSSERLADVEPRLRSVAHAWRTRWKL